MHVWTEQQEQAVLDYQRSDSISERSKIWEDFLYTPIKMLCEIIFERYRHQPNVKKEEVQDMMGKCSIILDRWDSSKGKVFSFLYTSLQRDCFEHYKKQDKAISLNSNLTNEDDFKLEDVISYNNSETEIDYSDFIKALADYWNEERIIQFVFKNGRTCDVRQKLIHYIKKVDCLKTGRHHKFIPGSYAASDKDFIHESRAFAYKYYPELIE